MRPSVVNLSANNLYIFSCRDCGLNLINGVVSVACTNLKITSIGIFILNGGYITTFMDYTSKIYFPFLYNNNIFSVKQLQTEQHSLITKTKKQLSENTVRGFENIDLFYDIFTNRQKSKYFYEKNN